MFLDATNKNIIYSLGVGNPTLLNIKKSLSYSHPIHGDDYLKLSCKFSSLGPLVLEKKVLNDPTLLVEYREETTF
jgi:hypothetical protein